MSRPTATSWMKLNCGDFVREPDGRHIGRVEAIHWSSKVLVRWLDSGFFETLDLAQLVALTPVELKANDLLPAVIPLNPEDRQKPKTLAPSPKFLLKWGLA